MTAKNENDGSALRKHRTAIRFLIRQAIFVVASLIFLHYLPVPSESNGYTEVWRWKGMNRLTAEVVATTYNATRTFHHKDEARIAFSAAVQLPFRMNGRETPIYNTLDFAYDNLFGIAVRCLVIFILAILILNPNNAKLKFRLQAMALAAAAYPCFHVLRGALFGMSIHLVDPIFYVQHIDPFVRVFCLAAFPAVGIARLPDNDKSESVRRTQIKSISAAAVIAVISLVLAGCKGSFSNNTITVNVGGGDVLPYIAIFVMGGWSTFKKFKQKITGADKGAAKPKGALKKLTQKEVADLFGPPCNADMVGNWESYGKDGVKRGAMPPSAEYGGKLYPYVRELRTNPTPENMEILGAIAKRFRETAAVQDGIESGKFTHPRSEESLYRARKA